jgi:putative ABC transport system permease protein
MGINTDFVRQYIPTITEMPDRDLVEKQYDLISDGELPLFTDDNKLKIMLVVDQYNSISDITLALLGYLGINVQENGSGGYDITFVGEESIPLEEIVGKKIYLANNSQMYTKIGDRYYINRQIGANRDELLELEIAGVLRAKENVSGVLPVGIAYMPNLTQYVLDINHDSEIVSAVTEGTLPVYDMFSPLGAPETFNVRTLAGIDTPSKIKVFAKDFDSKEIIKEYIELWNDTHENEEDQITYSDMMSMMFGMLTTMVDAVTYVLVAFTSISLVVSSVMIGIITYISVVERTKEIGVLRSLGASKREISSVFNAETFLIGLFAGLIRVGFTYLISIPLNIILGGLVSGVGKLVVLAPLSALILVLISITLTLISGLIPSRIAAKKDPVVALRTE